jgi:hypothetical protein
MCLPSLEISLKTGFPKVIKEAIGARFGVLRAIWNAESLGKYFPTFRSIVVTSSSVLCSPIRRHFRNLDSSG